MEQSTFDSNLERRIIAYINGELSEMETDELWTDLIQEEEALDYLKTVANLKKVAEERTAGSVVKSPRIGYADSGSRIEGVDSRFRVREGDHEISGERSNGANEPRQGSQRLMKRWMVGAIAALMLLTGAYGLLQTQVTDSALQPIGVIELDYYRSVENEDQESGERVIREAIVLANEGNSLQAIELIETELEQTGNETTRALLQINAGSILYNSSRYEDAAVRFEKVVQIEDGDPMVRERAYWYLGNTWFQLNHLEEARMAFRQAYDLNGAYRRIAQSYLEALGSS